MAIHRVYHLHRAWSRATKTPNVQPLSTQTRFMAVSIKYSYKAKLVKITNSSAKTNSNSSTCDLDDISIGYQCRVHKTTLTVSHLAAIRYAREQHPK